MRYSGLSIFAFYGLAACAGAQAAPTPPAAPAQPERTVELREREIAARARARAEGMQLRTERLRIRADSLRVRAHAVDSALMNRATLGLTLAPTGSRRDTLGIFVSSVVAGGPAEQAGIYEGDRIASINGVDVRTQPSDAGDAYLAGVAQRRLTLELRKLTPGQRVGLRVWSGGRYKDVQVTTGRYSEVYRNRRTEIRIGGEGLMVPRVPGVHVVPPAPLAPGRVLLPQRIELDLEDVPEAAEAIARVAAELANIELPIVEPLPDLDLLLERDLISDPLQFEYQFETGPIEFEYRVEADDHRVEDVEDLTHEALRQAQETLSGLERQVGAL